MNELRRMAYLTALGVDSYVSRRQLPGAATTQRLVIVPEARVIEPVDSSQGRARNDERRGSTAPSTPVSAAVHGGRVHQKAPVAASGQQASAVPHFSLAVIVAGDWLWLESLEGMPMATQQLRLVSAMAHALISIRDSEGGAVAIEGGASVVKTQWAQFDWPIHNNKQLDESAAAARASVATFVERRLQQHRCRGLVLLGRQCHQWVPREQLNIPIANTPSSAELLGNAALKPQAWRELLAFVSTV